MMLEFWIWLAINIVAVFLAETWRHAVLFAGFTAFVAFHVAFLRATVWR